jgi:hypothetical protein
MMNNYHADLLVTNLLPRASAREVLPFLRTDAIDVLSVKQSLTYHCALECTFGGVQGLQYDGELGSNFVAMDVVSPSVIADEATNISRLKCQRVHLAADQLQGRDYMLSDLEVWLLQVFPVLS